jgi:hypothetical protein
MMAPEFYASLYNIFDAYNSFLSATTRQHRKRGPVFLFQDKPSQNPETPATIYIFGYILEL